MIEQTTAKNKPHYKWAGYGLLYGAVLLSFVFYIVTMAVGFKVPSSTSTQSNIGLWDVKQTQTGIGSDLSDAGIACIVFCILNLGLLIAGFILHNKGNTKTNKFLKISVISSFLIFAIALILALAGKVGYDRSSITTNTTSINISIWMKITIIGTAGLEYTAAAIPVVILLSLSIVLPTVYTILGLTKIPYKN